MHCDYDNANQTKTSSIFTRSKFHKHNLLSHWWWKFAQAQNCSNCKQLTEREWSITGLKNLRSKWARHIWTSSKTASTNEEWIFHHDLKHWQLAQPLMKNLTFHHTKQIFSRLQNSYKTGRCWKAIVGCKDEMCSHKVLTNCTGLKAVFPWKPVIRQSFKEIRLK